jgi:hypothetical protein
VWHDHPHHHAERRAGRTGRRPAPTRPAWASRRPTYSRPQKGERSAVGNFITALRCLYNQAVADGLITEADDPASKVSNPRRLESTRHAVPDARLAEINQVAATTGNDPALDSLLLRLHIETACRRGATSRFDPSTFVLALLIVRRWPIRAVLVGITHRVDRGIA